MTHEYDRIPPRTRITLDNYVQQGIPTGDFLRAVLTNNLCEAVCRADNDNLPALLAIVQYVWNELPMDCWGSPEQYREWIKAHYVEAQA